MSIALFLLLAGVNAGAQQPGVPAQTCDDLLGRWEYVVPPSPLPGVVDVSKQADGRYMGHWERVQKKEGEPPADKWLVSCGIPGARWRILFGTRPAPSCRGELRERARPGAIEFVCHMPEGTETLAGAVRRTR